MSEPQTTEAPAKKRRGRSPNYPGIDLKTALERAKVLWEQEQHHPAATEVILKHWGYGPKSGGGSVVFAALKRFGLLEDVGSGRARLTARAQTILLAEREGRRDEGLIHLCALLPTIHKEMWAKYGGRLPSPESLKYELVTEKGFTPGGADEFISEWRRTLDFAKLSDAGATVSPNAGETPPEDTRIAEPTLTPPAATIEPDPVPPVQVEPLSGPERTTRTVQVTYSPDEWALLQGRFPMSEEDWDSMIAVLNAMKRGLVTRPRPTD